jgi:hypothetical protein
MRQAFVKLDENGKEQDKRVTTWLVADELNEVERALGSSDRWILDLSAFAPNPVLEQNRRELFIIKAGG